MNGNTSDRTTLRHFLKKIEESYGKAQRVWVMDRGIPSEAILKEMRDPDRQTFPWRELVAAHAAVRVRARSAAHSTVAIARAGCAPSRPGDELAGATGPENARRRGAFGGAEIDGREIVGRRCAPGPNGAGGRRSEGKARSPIPFDAVESSGAPRMSEFGEHKNPGA
jgi:hypothetical protein